MQGTTTAKTFLDNVVEYFNNNLNADKASTCQDAYDMIIVLQALSDDLSLTMDTDESYSLKVNISGKLTFFYFIKSTIFSRNYF